MRPARASIRNSTTSAAAIAASVCCLHAFAQRLRSAASSRPAVSITVNSRSPSRARPSRRSRVTPGVVVDQRQTLADQAIEQRGLADIRPSDDGDREAHAVERWQKPVGSAGARCDQRVGGGSGKPATPDAARRGRPASRGRLLPAAAAGSGHCGLLGSSGPAMSLAPALRPLSGSAARPVWRRASASPWAWASAWARRARPQLASARGGCGFGRRRGLGGLLIALDQFRRNALRHAGRAFREHGLALARQLLLGGEDVGMNNRRRIEDPHSLRARGISPSAAPVQRPMREQSGSLASPLRSCLVPRRGHQHLDARAGGGRRQRIGHDHIEPALGACVMSPCRQAASASNSRAVWRKVRSRPVQRLERCPRVVKCAGIDRAGRRRAARRDPQAPAWRRHRWRSCRRHPWRLSGRSRRARPPRANAQGAIARKSRRPRSWRRPPRPRLCLPASLSDIAVWKAAPLSAAFFASHQPYPRQPAMPATTHDGSGNQAECP